MFVAKIVKIDWSRETETFCYPVVPSCTRTCACACTCAQWFTAPAHMNRCYCHLQACATFFARMRLIAHHGNQRQLTVAFMLQGLNNIYKTSDSEVNLSTRSSFIVLVFSLCLWKSAVLHSLVTQWCSGASLWTVYFKYIYVLHTPKNTHLVRSFCNTSSSKTANRK